MIRHAAVVIPARDEAERIDACLTSVLRSVAHVKAARVDVVVVADGCLDDTPTRAERYAGVHVITTEPTNVGTARHTGVELALRLGAQWISNTDADSVVPIDWLATHLELAAAGADVVVGTVRPDFAELTSTQRDAWTMTHSSGQALGHVHAANLGFRATPYRIAGGFPLALEHEDVDLVNRLRLRARIAQTSRAEVVTSGRPVGRTPGGYARFLREQLLSRAEAHQAGREASPGTSWLVRGSENRPSSDHRDGSRSR